MIFVEEKIRLPRLSLAERDRRWKRARDLMAREGLDGIVGFPHQGHWDQFQADVFILKPGLNHTLKIGDTVVVE